MAETGTTAVRRDRDESFLKQRFPHLGPQLVVLVSIAIDFGLPDRLNPAGRLLPAVEALLVFALMAVSPHPRLRHSRLRRYFALALTGFVSAVNIVSLVLLVHYLLKGHVKSGHSLILAGAGLWASNVLLFGLWYWEIDRGGPQARATHPGEPDFLFPQMNDDRWAPKDWLPGLIDYLYVSFTNASAFSPTDTMPLTRTAKTLMSIQALVALVTVGLVVARAVNILG